MKNVKRLLVIFLILPCMFLFGACSMIETKRVYVTNIQQTSTIDGTTTYTVYYSNGTTSLFTVNNGTDGKDGSNLTIESIKEYCEANKIDFDSFLKEYLTIIKEENTVQDATSVAIQSAVTIWCEFPVRNYYNMKDTSVACGSGIIYELGDEYSYIITNYHVVYYSDCDTLNKIAKKIHIFQYGTSEAAYETNSYDENGYPLIEYGYGAVEAEFVGGSLNYDLAVLKVKTDDLKKYNENVSEVTIADSYNLGETAIAIGNPECEGFSVTSGIISVVSEYITMTGADDYTECTFRVMRVDTAVNGGNSGGGLFDINGKLIGIVNAKAVANDIDNIAYAIPYENVIAVVNNILHYYEKDSTDARVRKLVLDVKYTTKNNRAIYNPTTNKISLIEDIVINSVDYNSGTGVGYLIGLQSGDILKSITINGVKHNLTQYYQLNDLLLTIHEGDKFIIEVSRNNITHELGITTEQGVLEEQLDIIA